MKSKIFFALGPLFAAFILLGVLLASPLSLTPKYSGKQLKEFAADPMNRAAFVGYSVKQQAMADKSFLPVMGSSELERFDPYHPSVYSFKYQTSYTPFLLGQPGTQSLTHYFWLNSVAPEMQHRKIIFIISPQWFVKRGILPAMLENFTSKGEIDNWLMTANPKDVATQTLAKRLLAFKSFDSDSSIHSALESLQKGEALKPFNRFEVQVAARIWKREDSLFSGFDTGLTASKNPLNNLSKLAQRLPDEVHFSQLDSEAHNMAESNSGNNPYRINDKVWDKSLKNRVDRMEGYQTKVSYLQSPEYTDFQLLLNEFVKNHDDVQFIIQPVNNKWYSYTGLSQKMLQQFSSKIKEQLASQGFTHIADYTNKSKTPYYVSDTDHIGYRGWVAVDKSISDFMKSKSTSSYHLDNGKYLSEDWQKAK
ncbi:MAG: D-alanyl-lipoteichoic acid biosynthesis protein DltD [Streptococcaceae bacterium]|jgi:D-alanine transfer protein|nr:D-alanyl-lipoteichoic acid biosynthesis protein DltD [Streptococcaceae bacterium]